MRNRSESLDELLKHPFPPKKASEEQVSTLVMMKMEWRRQRPKTARKGRCARPGRWAHRGQKGHRPRSLFYFLGPFRPRVVTPGPGSLARQLGMRQRTSPSGWKGGSDPASGGGARPSGAPLRPSWLPASREAFRKARGCGSLEPGGGGGCVLLLRRVHELGKVLPFARVPHRSGVGRVLMGRVCLARGVGGFRFFLRAEER